MGSPGRPRAGEGVASLDAPKLPIPILPSQVAMEAHGLFDVLEAGG